jgi:hypothetical protein
MDASSEKIINEVVEDLVQSQMAKSKEETVKTEEETVKSEEVKTEETVKSEEVKTEVKSEVNIPKSQNMKNVPDLSVLLKGLMQSIMPPEIKNNKDINGMFTSLFSSFESLPNELPTVNKVEPKKENKVVSDQNQESEDNDNCEDCDCEDDDDDDDDDCEDDDDDCEDDDCDDCDCEDDGENIDEEITLQNMNKNALFFVRHNDNNIGYTCDYEEAYNKAVELHNDFIYFNEHRYVRTVKSKYGFMVYERNPFTLFPFMEQLVCKISIEKVFSL